MYTATGQYSIFVNIFPESSLPTTKYSIPYSCDKVYNGETSYPLKVRVEEHWKVSVQKERERVGREIMSYTQMMQNKVNNVYSKRRPCEPVTNQPPLSFNWKPLSSLLCSTWRPPTYSPSHYHWYKPYVMQSRLINDRVLMDFTPKPG